MFTTATFSRLLCLVGLFALATVASPAELQDAAHERPPSDDDFCPTAPPNGAPVCSSLDLLDNQPAFEDMFSGVTRGRKVRPVNDSSITTQHIIREVQRLAAGRTSHSQDLTLWMFIEFLKAAPLFMGLGCIMTIFVALRQKWSDLANSEASVKIRWTKPAAC